MSGPSGAHSSPASPHKGDGCGAAAATATAAARHKAARRRSAAVSRCILIAPVKRAAGRRARKRGLEVRHPHSRVWSSHRGRGRVVCKMRWYFRPAQKLGALPAPPPAVLRKAASGAEQRLARLLHAWYAASTDPFCYEPHRGHRGCPHGGSRTHRQLPPGDAHRWPQPGWTGLMRQARAAGQQSSSSLTQCLLAGVSGPSLQAPEKFSMSGNAESQIRCNASVVQGGKKRKSTRHN